jgi:hypothetical protein
MDESQIEKLVNDLVAICGLRMAYNIKNGYIDKYQPLLVTTTEWASVDVYTVMRKIMQEDEDIFVELGEEDAFILLHYPVPKTHEEEPAIRKKRRSDDL